MFKSISQLCLLNPNDDNYIDNILHNFCIIELNGLFYKGGIKQLVESKYDVNPNIKLTSNIWDCIHFPVSIYEEVKDLADNIGGNVINFNDIVSIKHNNNDIPEQDESLIIEVICRELLNIFCKYFDKSNYVVISINDNTSILVEPRTTSADNTTYIYIDLNDLSRVSCSIHFLEFYLNDKYNSDSIVKDIIETITTNLKYIVDSVEIHDFSENVKKSCISNGVRLNSNTGTLIGKIIK